MPFQFDQYRNPFVSSISSLMQAPAQAQAQAALTGGQAQANAALQNGQAWSGAANQIGQTVAAIPQQMQQQKMQALQTQHLQGEIEDRNVRNAAMQRDLKAQATWADALKTSVGADGKPDYEKAAGIVSQAGFPVQANTFLEGIQKTKATSMQLIEASQKIEAGKQQAQKALSSHMGELGAVGLGKLNSEDPLTARDHMTGLVAAAAATGAISEDDARKFLMQSAQAGPQQLASIYQGFLDKAPDVKSRLVGEDLKKAETAKNNAEAAKAMNEVQGGKPPTAEQSAERYRQIAASIMQKQPVSDNDLAWAGAYDKQKTIPTDAAAKAASDRQTAAILQQIAQQGRSQSFQEAQAGRKELTEKVEQPFQTARTSADTMRATVAAARAGNKTAAALQNLETTMAAIRAQGLNRINTAEIGVTANAGSIWDRIQSAVGKATSGQGVAPDIQKDMLAFADILDKAAEKKYLDGFKAVTTRYGLKDEKPLVTQKAEPLKVGNYSVVVRE